MHRIAKTSAAIQVIVYAPKTEDGQRELEKRVAEVHASAVTQQIKALNCPESQKQMLLHMAIETARKRSRGSTL
ncbi:MAG: hypothetical protein IKB53_07650 [Oscillospiraceae bacterium]|nr:hypothetical protein [Oscillospiraceae bacterium]